MTTRAQVQEAIANAQAELDGGYPPRVSRSTLLTLVIAAESARYKSITGKPVTDPVYESPSDVLEGAL